jgi:non-ribosomal peptide synthetase-like protein
VAVAGLTQTGLLYLLMAAFGLPLALVFSASGGEVSAAVLWRLAATVPVTYLLGRWVLPIAGTRLLGIRLRPGRYPLWGVTYLRAWAIGRLLALSPVGALAGSPLLRPYLRLLGARVGRGCHIATAAIPLPTMVEIGAGASIGYGVQLQAFTVEDGWVTIGRVTVGEGAFAGSNAVLLPGARLGDGARLAEQSLCSKDQTIPDWEHWDGSPSAPSTEADPLLDAMTRRGAPQHRRAPLLLAGFGAGLLVIELLPFAMIAPVIALIWYWLLRAGLLAGFAATLLSGPVFVVSACTLVWALKRVAGRTTLTGIHPSRSGAGLRKWLSDKLLEASLTWTNSLYATLWTSPWLRALGASIGPRAEVSTAAHLDPELLELGEESFIADMASVGGAVYCNGLVAIRRTRVGRRAFVGNAAAVRSGTQIGDGSLVGVLTVPQGAEVPAGTSWLGSPAMFLPRRQDSGVFADELTYQPSRLRIAERLAIEYVRATLPATLIAASVFMVLYLTSITAAKLELLAVVAAVPAIMLLGGLAVVLVVAAVKWALVGRYRPRVEPLWSRFVRRTELVTGLYETAAVPALLAGFTGTPVLGPMLRLFGARIGRRTCIDTTFMTEFDLVRIGDDAAVGTSTSLQTHLFEDRVMKMSVLVIGSGASVGARAVVLYDTEVGNEATLDALSLVMKGERLPPGTSWRGIPGRSVS